MDRWTDGWMDGQMDGQAGWQLVRWPSKDGLVVR